MTPLTNINITIEIFCSVLCFIFIVCIILIDSFKTKLNKAFIYVLLSNIAVMMSDATAFYSIGKMSPVFLVLNYVGNILCYIFSYVLIIAFSYYLSVYFATKTKVPRTYFRIVCVSQGIAVILVFIALYNNMYFTIDQQNIYHRESMYWFSQAMGIFGMLVNATMIVRYHKYLSRAGKFALSCYIILPIIAIIIQMLVYGLVSVYIASTLTIVFIYLGIQAQQGRINKENELALAENRISMMISQIQPHFLYNSLAAIRELCASNPDEAWEALGTFSMYLRGNIDSLTQERVITFQKELDHVNAYLELERKRLGEKLNVVFSIQVGDFFIPALTVQPIVENAVRYGVACQPNGGLLTIEAFEENNNFMITIADDGPGFDVQAAHVDGRAHIGIRNVRERLASICGGRLEIKSGLGLGTIATIIVPKGGKQF